MIGLVNNLTLIRNFHIANLFLIGLWETNSPFDVLRANVI